MASLGLNLDEQKAVDRFRKDVVEPSMTKLVILDFWAEWCGPCKALAPVLEKVAAEYADKGVVLAKLNVDEEGFIAIRGRLKRLWRTLPTNWRSIASVISKSAITPWRSGRSAEIVAGVRPIMRSASAPTAWTSRP